MSIDLNSSKDYPGRIALNHKTHPDSNSTTIIALTWEDLEELAHSAQQILGLPAKSAPAVEEFFPDNPGNSAPYFYYVTESESEAREGLFEGGKLMHRFITSWEEVK